MVVFIQKHWSSSFKTFYQERTIWKLTFTWHVLEFLEELIFRTLCGQTALFSTARGVFGTLPNIWDGAFCENSYRLKIFNYFRKEFYLRCLTGFWTRFWPLLSFYPCVAKGSPIIRKNIGKAWLHCKWALKPETSVWTSSFLIHCYRLQQGLYVNVWVLDSFHRLSHS